MSEIVRPDFLDNCRSSGDVISVIHHLKDMVHYEKAIIGRLPPLFHREQLNRIMAIEKMITEAHIYRSELRKQEETYFNELP